MADKGQFLTLAQAAALLGRSERFVGKLRESGYVETPAPGQYPLVGLLRGAMAYHEDLLSRQAETARQTAATDARTREIELRIRRKMANLIEANIPCEVIDEFVAAAATELRTIPGRLYRDRQRRTELRSELEASIARITKLTEAAQRRLKTGEI